MKTLIIITLATFLSLVGCTGNEIERVDRDYIIENDTDFSVNIKFYGRVDRQLSIKSKILENRGDQLSARLTQSDFDNSGYNTSAAFQGDSVKVIINNLKFYVNTFNTFNDTYSEPLDRNLFRHLNYENLGNERYLFKITQQDYENAEDCNGNCD